MGIYVPSPLPTTYYHYPDFFPIRTQLKILNDISMDQKFIILSEGEFIYGATVYFEVCETV
jgi:hypothetical protein